MNSKLVLVPLAQGCEELEAVTIVDLLVRAGIEVITASLDDQKMIHASRGIVLMAQTTLEDIKDWSFDMIVLPGGLPGADHLEESTSLKALLIKTAAAGGILAAICAAPKVFVSAGLLDGKKATGYPGGIDVFPAKGMTYLSDAVVEDGQIITSRGPGTAMDFALTLVERLTGVEQRNLIEKGLVRF